MCNYDYFSITSNPWFIDQYISWFYLLVFIFFYKNFL